MSTSKAEKTAEEILTDIEGILPQEIVYRRSITTEERKIMTLIAAYRAQQQRQKKHGETKSKRDSEG